MTVSSSKINFWILLPFNLMTLAILLLKLLYTLILKYLHKWKASVVTGGCHSNGKFLLKLSALIFWNTNTLKQLVSNMWFPYLLYHIKSTGIKKKKKKKLRGKQQVTWSFFFSSSTCRSCSEVRTISIHCMSLISKRWDSKNWSLAFCHVCFNWLCCCRSCSKRWQTIQKEKEWFRIRIF